jgi:hypothetical protein
MSGTHNFLHGLDVDDANLARQRHRDQQIIGEVHARDHVPASYQQKSNIVQNPIVFFSITNALVDHEFLQQIASGQ